MIVVGFGLGKRAGRRALSLLKRPACFSRGLMLMVPTPVLDHFMPFDNQISTVRTGIAATRTLREWFVSHQDTVRGWAALVPDGKAT